jgi:hypothetical protein
MPPEPSAEPEEDANAAAWPWTMGSEAACWARTSLRMERKRGFSVRESGVGGILLVVPIERGTEGGEVGRSVRRCAVDGEDGCGKTY